MKAKLKFFGQIVLFSLLLCVLLFLADTVLSFKYEDGILTMRNYYKLPADTVDVLLLGSSHMGVDVNPSTLWKEYGIASYCCWGAMQPTWNTYYYLNECLKTQTPKLVVVDVYGATFSADYADYSYAVKNTMGMRLSRDKWEAIQVSARQSQWATLLLGLPAYHARYGEVTAADFTYFPWDRHTALQTIASSEELVYPTIIPDTAAITGTQPLTEKNELYLRRILTLCAQKDIPVELVAAPYTLTETEEQRFRSVQTIAEEYGVSFTNYSECYKDIGILPASDFRDEGHLNDSGVQKYTTALGKRWKQTYALPDRREDPSHIWNQPDEDDLAPLYQLPEQFIGDGKQNYVDTGLSLYENPLASWTLLAEVDAPGAGDADKVFFACYNEADDDYHGLLVHGKQNGAIAIAYSSLAGMEIKEPSGTLRFAFVKEGRHMDVYCNGVCIQSITLDQIKSYSGPLLVGCQERADGGKFRFSETTVHALEVYGAAMSEDFVRAWAPQWPPKPQEPQTVSDTGGASLKLAQRFVGDGVENCVDTGRALYADPDASWTLLSQISPQVDAGDQVYFSCFNEEDGAFRGLLVRRAGEGTLNILYGDGLGFDTALPTDTDSTLIVVKNRSEYTIYLNGTKILDSAASVCESYDGNLLVGCEERPDGTRLRYSGTTVYNLWVVDGVLAESELLAWAPAYAPAPQKDAGAAVAYTLPQSFAGNGKDSGLDTGVRLYDVPDKNWSLQFQVDRDDANTGAVLSCFAEDADNYRGLMVRQLDADTYAFTLGQTYQEVTVSDNRVAAFAVVKEGTQYSLYANGELAATLNSRCAAYDGPLVIGCERTLAGVLFRSSEIRVRRLTVTSHALTPAQVRDFWDEVKQ